VDKGLIVSDRVRLFTRWLVRVLLLGYALAGGFGLLNGYANLHFLDQHIVRYILAVLVYFVALRWLWSLDV
jgi:hypothetical protein